jgi:hypothetical protein
MDQMDLAQVGLIRISPHVRTVLHLLAEMSIAVDTKPGDESNDGFIRLRERV